MFQFIVSRVCLPIALVMILVSCGLNSPKNTPSVVDTTIPVNTTTTGVVTVVPPNMQDIMNNPPCESKSTIPLQQQCFVDRAVSKNDVFVCENIKDIDKQILCRDAVVIANARTKEDCKRGSDINIQNSCIKLLK